MSIFSRISSRMSYSDFTSWYETGLTVLQERTVQFCPQLYLHKEKELKGERAISEEGVF